MRVWWLLFVVLVSLLFAGVTGYQLGARERDRYDVLREMQRSTERWRSAMIDKAEAEQAAAFAHGYIYGQRGAIRAAGLPVKMPALGKGAIETRAIASKHGFHQADGDPGDEHEH